MKGLNRTQLMEACFALGDMCKEKHLNADVFLNRLLVEGMNLAYKRIARKLLADMPKNGYKVNFSVIELNAVYYLRNTLLIESDYLDRNVALTRLLELNK
jgi:hypothetical protein